ncbi:MAG TPA: histidinol-phosphate transaminase [Candidatus Limnocylindria bacterium]|nr:histidinol-phosphate transaminase [Candidatus Limnocylindria bacterium]
MTELPRPRDDLAGQKAYATQQLPGADVRLQANEWTEPNPAGKWLTSEELGSVLLNRYPGGGPSGEVRAAIAKQHGVEPEQIILGNGSNELLFSTFIVFGGHGRTTLLFHPTYAMHGRLTTLAGGTVAVEKVGLPYDLRADRALAAMERVRPHVVAFTSPNNPTGNTIPDDVVLTVAARYPRTLVLLDEAYADLAGRSLIPAVAAYANVVVAKTFSKVRAAAGLRLGYLIAHPELAEVYRAAQLPYSISAVTYAIALKMLREDGDIAGRVERCRVERERVIAALSRVPGVSVYPSVTNFVLFRVHDGDTARVHARFLEEGVLIRDVSMWPGCEGCLRASIGTAGETDRFIAALAHAFAPAVA